MKRFACIAALCSMLIWAGIASAAGGPKIESEEDVVGKIRVLCDIAGVKVQLAGFSFLTKAGKAVVVGEIPVGAHEVVATKEGYRTWRSPVTVTPDATVQINIKMWAATGAEAEAVDSDQEAVEKVIKAKEELAQEKEQATGGSGTKAGETSAPATASAEEKPSPKEAQPVAGEAPAQVKEAEPAAEEAKPAAEEAKPVVEEAKPAAEEAKADTQDAKPAVEETKTVAKEPQPKVEEAPKGKDEAGKTDQDQDKQAGGEEDVSVDSLLASAQEDMKALRLTTPAANNALDKYNMVLAADPANAEAKKGLSRIVAIYVRLAQRAQGKGEAKKAERLLTKAAKAVPDDPRIANMRDKIKKAELAAAKKKEPKVAKAEKKPALPKVWVNTIGMKFILCPAGDYLMGSKAGEGYADERPQRKVTFSKPFYMGAFEVTQLEYQRVTGENPAKFRETASDFQAKLQRPVERVDWAQAKKFCAMLGDLDGGKVYRLPTEAEWEYACRAGRDRLGPVGVKGSQTLPIGKSEPNPWGIFDMQGNVFEWCSDYFSPKTYGLDVSADPQGPPEGRDRVARGGSYMSDHTDDGSTGSNQRGHFPPHFRKEFIGFRVVRVP